MKKITFLMVLLVLFLSGCGNLMNTPTKKVEELFSKYQKVDNDINTEIDQLLATETLTDTQKTKYKDIISNQYKKLTYVVKDEEVNGDNAIVKVEIEVVDFKKVVDDLDSKYSNDTTLDKTKYIDEKLDLLDKAKEKVKYTLDINVTKDNDGNWKVTGLTSSDIKKIQGMY